MVFGEYKYELSKRDNLFGYVEYKCLKQNSKLNIQQSVYFKGINVTREDMTLDKNSELETISLLRRGKKICEMKKIFGNLYILNKDTYISFKTIKYYPLMIYQKDYFETQDNIFSEKTVMNYTPRESMHFVNMVSLIEGNKLTILSPGKLRCRYSSNGLLDTCFDAATEFRIQLI